MRPHYICSNWPYLILCVPWGLTDTDKLDRVATNDSLNHVGSTLSHAASEGIHIDLALGISLIQQWIQCNICSRSPYTSTNTATHSNYEFQMTLHITFTWHQIPLYPILHTHTHKFNGPFSRTIRVGRYQKGKTNVDFTEARDSEWQWHHLGICKSAPRSRQITMPAPHHSVFLQTGCPSCHPTNSVKALKANCIQYY